MDFNFTEMDVNNEDDLDWLYWMIYGAAPPEKRPDKEDFQEYILKESVGFRYKVSLGEEVVALANFPHKKSPGQLYLAVSMDQFGKISGKDILKAIRSHKDIPEFHEFFISDKEHIPYLTFVGSTVCKNKVKGVKVSSISRRCYCCNYVDNYDGFVLLMADNCLVEEDCDC